MSQIVQVLINSSFDIQNLISNCSRIFYFLRSVLLLTSASIINRTYGIPLDTISLRRMVIRISSTLFVIDNLICFISIFNSTIFLRITYFQWNKHSLGIELVNWSRIALFNPFSKSQVTENGSNFHLETINTQWRVYQYKLSYFPVVRTYMTGI